MDETGFGTPGRVVDGVQNVHLKDWPTFVDYILRNFNDKHGVCWRGQCHQDWPLHPSIVRSLVARTGRFSTDYEWNISRIFEAFKESLEAFSEYSSYQFSTNDIWALGQHFGLKTPLLDWTKSPFVALYFAFAFLPEETHRDTEGNVELFGLTSSFLSDNKVDCGTPACTHDSEYQFISIFDVKPKNRRLLAQQGLFTAVWPPIDIERLVQRRFVRQTFAVLRKVTIPKSERAHVLTGLNRMNISFQTLYPDLQGAALQSNHSLFMPGYLGKSGGETPAGLDFFKS